MKPAIIISLTLISIASSMHLPRSKSALPHQLSTIPESEGNRPQQAQPNQNWLQEIKPEAEPYQEARSPFETEVGVNGWHRGLKQGPAVSLSEMDKQEGYAGWMRQNELVRKPKIQHSSSKFYPEGKHFQNTGFGFMRDYDAEKSQGHLDREEVTSYGAEDKKGQLGMPNRKKESQKKRADVDFSEQFSSGMSLKDEDLYKTYNTYGELVDLPPPISYSEGKPYEMLWGQDSL
ncbi:hypothetical protein MIR68_003835 [Amoeboaphelidium protococcarum]|nr:hypothetical protein MIR68_003835 [Amoeboaphelidium protococcarum]